MFRVLNLRFSVVFTLSRGADVFADASGLSSLNGLLEATALRAHCVPMPLSLAGNISDATELARSRVLHFRQRNEPTGGHLAPAGPGSLLLTWTAASAHAPTVRWVRLAARVYFDCNMIECLCEHLL